MLPLLLRPPPPVLALLTLAASAAGSGGGDELWRPRLHFYFRDPTSGVGFHSNDATGSYFDEVSGRWHAFYDCTPPVDYATGRRPERYSWCEASSDSLVHWRQAARAVLPENAACDWENLETGAISRAPATGELVAIFSAKGNESHPSGAPEWEHVCAARGGVLPPTGGGGGGDSSTFHVVNYTLIANANNGSGFRDPSRAIQLSDGNHYVVIGTDAGYTPAGVRKPAGAASDAGAASLVDSPKSERGQSQKEQLAQASLWVNRDGSLLNWEPAGVLLSDPAAKFPECPDLMPLFSLVPPTEPTSIVPSATGTVSRTGAAEGDATRGSDGTVRGQETPLPPEQPYLFLASETFRRGTRWYMGTLQPVSNSTQAGYRMVVQEQGQLDYGCGTRDMAFYAPRTMAPIRSAVGRGRRVLLGWIRANPNGRATCNSYTGCQPYLAHGINWTFGDFAALPRELSFVTAAHNAGEEAEASWHRIADGGGITMVGSMFAQRFVPELRALRPTPGNSSTSGTTTLAITLQAGQQPQEARVLGVKGRELEIVLRATARGDGCVTAKWSASISFLRSERIGSSKEDGEASTLAIQHAPAADRASSGGNWTLLLDRSRSSSTNSSWVDRSNISAPLPRAAASSGMGGEGSSTLHAYVDNSIVETIADNLTALTARVFPQRGDSTSLMISLRGEQHEQRRRWQSNIDFFNNATEQPADVSCTITASFSVWALAGAEHDWG